MFGRNRWFALVLLLALTLAACGPAAEATPTSQPTQAAPPPTAALSPTVTQVPSGATAAPPTARPTSAPPTAKPTSAPPAVAGPKYGGTAIAYIRDWPLEWDFQKHIKSARHFRAIHQSVFNSLAGKAATGTKSCEWDIVPDLAQSWAWTSDTTFEVKLAQGVKFQNKAPVNGREMTSEDVLWSWKRIMEMNPRMDALKQTLKEMQAVDRYTVRFQTKNPFPTIMSYLAFGTTDNIVARESGDFSRDKTWGDWDTPEKSWVGTGPFTFVKAVTAVRVELKRNPDYFQKGLPYLDSLVFLDVPDMSTRLAAMTSGKLDLWYAEVPVVIAASLARMAPQLQVQRCPTITPLVTFMRTDQPPLNDVRVRRAALMALDQENYVKTAFGGQAVRSTILPPLNAGYLKLDEFSPELRRNMEYNPAEAKRLLAEAGYPNGFDTVFNAYSGYGSPYTEAMETMSQMLNAVGIRAKLTYLLRAVYDQQTVSGEWQGFRAAKAGDIENPYVHFGSYHSKTPIVDNKSHVVDRELDPLIEQFAITTDAAKGADLLKRIQYRLADQVYILVAPNHYDYSIAQPWVKDFVKAGDEPTSRFWSQVIWLDK
ncbi:MAG: hypothetical protein HYY01_07240 [Chloroflexi bacterium]|nr:hypothetical protein [Chloroflexota bacterium]